MVFSTGVRLLRFIFFDWNVNVSLPVVGAVVVSATVDVAAVDGAIVGGAAVGGGRHRSGCHRLGVLYSFGPPASWYVGYDLPSVAFE